MGRLQGTTETESETKIVTLCRSVQITTKDIFRLALDTVKITAPNTPAPSRLTKFQTCNSQFNTQISPGLRRRSVLPHKPATREQSRDTDNLELCAADKSDAKSNFLSRPLWNRRTEEARWTDLEKLDSWTSEQEPQIQRNSYSGAPKPHCPFSNPSMCRGQLPLTWETVQL